MNYNIVKYRGFLIKDHRSLSGFRLPIYNNTIFPFEIWKTTADTDCKPCGEIHPNLNSVKTSIDSALKLDNEEEFII